jgi:hypothetical protein
MRTSSRRVELFETETCGPVVTEAKLDSDAEPHVNIGEYLT